MLKLVTVVGTRPEIIRLSRIIPKLDLHFNHTFIHTGQNYDYELNEIFFSDLSLRKPDYYLDACADSAMHAVSDILLKFDLLLDQLSPDALLVLGDTNSSLCAYAAKRRQIPIFHMEAGNRSFDQRVPEEINRRVVDHLSDINLPYSQIARSYLLREGFPPDQVIVTGSPMKEVLDFYHTKIFKSSILDKLSLKKGNYFLFSCHRAENVDSDIKLNQLFLLLQFLAEKYSLPIIFSTHPRTRSRLNSSSFNFSPLVRFCPPFCFTDYINLQTNALCVLSDSGTISEESSILRFPALNIRDSHERPEAMEHASVVLSGLDVSSVSHCIDIVLSQSQHYCPPVVSDYDVLNVSDKIVRILLSYTDYINRVVWKKY